MPSRIIRSRSDVSHLRLHTSHSKRFSQSLHYFHTNPFFNYLAVLSNVFAVLQSVFRKNSSFHTNLFANCQYCESMPELQYSAVIPRSCAYRVSKHRFILLCLIKPLSRISHRWLSLSSHVCIITIDPLANVTSVKQRSWWRIWPVFVMVHSWLPPVSWHW